MSDQNSAFNWLGATIAAALSGLAGTVIGVKVQGTEIKNIKERQDREGHEMREWLGRVEEKLDRLIERL